MSDSVDTIRRALREYRSEQAHTFDSGPCQGPALCKACFGQAALTDFERLVAERDTALRALREIADEVNAGGERTDDAFASRGALIARFALRDLAAAGEPRE